MRYHIGQLVVVRDSVEENWHCARVYQVTPQVLVKRRPRSTPSKFNFVKPLEARHVLQSASAHMLLNSTSFSIREED